MCLRACLGEAFRQTEAVFSSLGLYSLDSRCVTLPPPCFCGSQLASLWMYLLDWLGVPSWSPCRSGLEAHSSSLASDSTIPMMLSGTHMVKNQYLNEP
jgi:hypothetical protein